MTGSVWRIRIVMLMSDEAFHIAIDMNAREPALLVYRL